MEKSVESIMTVWIESINNYFTQLIHINIYILFVEWIFYMSQNLLSSKKINKHRILVTDVVFVDCPRLVKAITSFAGEFSGEIESSWK
jgi:hypothetical protein